MKLLFSLLLSGLILAPLSSFARLGGSGTTTGTAVGTVGKGQLKEFKPQNRNIFNPQEPGAFKPLPLDIPIGVNAVETINAFSKASQILPRKAKELLNEATARLNQSETKVSVPMNLLVKNCESISSNLSLSGMSTTRDFNALANAVRLSVKETWSAPAKNSLSKHIISLADQIDTILRDKQIEVEGRCRV